MCIYAVVGFSCTVRVLCFHFSVICLLHERVLKKKKCTESCIHRRCVKNLKHGIFIGKNFWLVENLLLTCKCSHGNRHLDILVGCHQATLTGYISHFILANPVTSLRDASRKYKLTLPSHLESTSYELENRGD